MLPGITLLRALRLLPGLRHTPRPAGGLVFRNGLHFPVRTFPEQVKQGRSHGLRRSLHFLQFLRQHGIRLETFQDIIHQGLCPELVHLNGSQHRFRSQLNADETFNAAHQGKITAPHKSDGLPLAAGACRAADAVHVILRITRQFKIHHGIHIVHIQAASGNIRRHQKAQAPLAEGIHHALPHHLGHIPMKAIHRITAGRQTVHHVIHHLFGIGEHQPHFNLSGVKQPAEHLNPGGKHHFVINLFNGRHRQRRPFNGNLDGLLHEPAHQAADFRRHGSGEKQGLLLFRHSVRDMFDIFQKPHIQHLVRFIQNQHAETIQP